MEKTNAIVVLITAGSRQEAEKLAERLVDERLAACCSLVGNVTSFFRWKGAVQKESEILIIAKTSADTFERLKARVRELHSYDVPEIIALPVVAGLDEYLKWIHDETGGL